MDVLHASCCGLDVHKKMIAACVLRCDKNGRKRKEIRSFGTTTQSLLALADWLAECGVTHTAMESTGVYWKPVWNILEDRFQILLVNAQHIKSVPGRKTDTKDCEWIADLLQHGLLRASFVPPPAIRELRDLTRYRVALTRERATVANRIQKFLEDANIKLASVATDILGQSGRSILAGLVAGENDAEKLAERARGRLRGKIPELRLALEGHLREHHRFLLQQLLEQLEFIELQIAKVEGEIERRIAPFQNAVARWRTVPGINEITAWNLVAEIGVDMNQFPSAAHLAAWAGVCPGNNESAGKRRSGKMRAGNPWLRRALCQAAWPASRTAGTYFSAQYRRLAARRGRKRAIMAVAHTLLVVAYCMAKEGRDYYELGADYFDQLNADGLKRYLVKRLARIGYKATLEPLRPAG